MAPHHVPNLAPQKTNPLPLLLVAELPRHPAHLPHGAAQRDAAEDLRAAVRADVLG